jgi:hypothetical protein
VVARWNGDCSIRRCSGRIGLAPGQDGRVAGAGVGKPQRTVTVEPLEDPVPGREPAERPQDKPSKQPAEPEKQPRR